MDIMSTVVHDIAGMDIATDPPATDRLSSLPREIRDLIYDQLIDPDRLGRTVIGICAVRTKAGWSMFYSSREHEIDRYYARSYKPTSKDPRALKTASKNRRTLLYDVTLVSRLFYVEFQPAVLNSMFACVDMPYDGIRLRRKPHFQCEMEFITAEALQKFNPELIPMSVVAKMGYLKICQANGGRYFSKDPDSDSKTSEIQLDTYGSTFGYIPTRTEVNESGLQASVYHSKRPIPQTAYRLGRKVAEHIATRIDEAVGEARNAVNQNPAVWSEGFVAKLMDSMHTEICSSVVEKFKQEVEAEEKGKEKDSAAEEAALR